MTVVRSYDKRSRRPAASFIILVVLDYNIKLQSMILSKAALISGIGVLSVYS